MRGQRVEIKGINRLVGSADNDVGCCSELINLSEQNGIKVVGQREITSADIPFVRIRQHRINKTINYIGIQDDATGVKVVHFNPDSGEVLQEIISFPAGSDIQYVFLNNQLVISDRTAIKEYVYIFKDTYELLYDGLDFDVDHELLGGFYGSNSDLISMLAPSEAQYLASCQAEINKFKINNRNYTEGAFQYAFTITLYDGTETGMYGFNSVMTDCTHWQGTPNAFIYAAPASNSTDIITTFYWSRFFQAFLLKIPAKSNDFLSKYKDLIKKVNLYVSSPITKMLITEDRVNIDGTWVENKVTTGLTDIVTIDPLPTKDMGIEKALLYKQKSWGFDEYCKGIDYVLEFGGDKQTTGATMEVYGTTLDRAGKMYTYNNRVHFYDSLVRLKPSISSMLYDSSMASVGTATATVYVYIRANEKDCVFKYEDVVVSLAESENTIKLLLPEQVVFADSRAYKMDIIVGPSDTYAAPYTGKITIELSSSPAYNYAYTFCGIGFDATLQSYDDSTPALSDTYTETNAVNVTASGTPMVFPVEHSYKFDGNITSLAVATESISESQVGQYPVSVFTDNGIYALQQGSGAVLYSNIVPISGDICTNANTIYTRQGIAYISNGAVYLLSGRRASKLSLLLEGEPDIYIQDNDSFLKCCGNSLYDITPYLSQVHFREYVKDAALSWCADTNELIVSNPAYTYSYIYDFVFNSWHKETGTFETIGANLVLSPVQLTTTNATPSTGKVTLQAIHSEEARSFSSICYATFSTTLSCGAGHTMALVVDGTQIASALFGQITRMNMILSTLCEDIGYLEDYKGALYSSLDLTSKVVKVYNLTTNTEIWTATFTASAQTVSIPNKAIGATISVTINGKAYTSTYSSSDSVVTTLSRLTSAINDNDANVSAQMIRNNIVLTSRSAGSSANSITLSATSTDSEYIYITTTAMTGGSDISLQPSQYRQIIDWSRQSEISQQIVHLHTRPLHLSDNNTYKTIKRSVLNCLAKLSGSHNLSLYIYASDNLTKWKCIAAAQRKECDISQITTDRAAKAYKYFIFMIGGIVPYKTQLSDIILTLDDVVTKKLR